MNAMKVENPGCEKEHDFALILTGIDDITDEVENALFEAGCDDATLSMRCGIPYLSFSRVAPSIKDAIVSAIHNIRNAGIGADVLRVDDCDLVTQAEIARRIGRTRQAAHQYITGERGPGKFPRPACIIADRAPLWYWCEVAYWLRQNNMIRDEELRDATEIAVINAALELRHQETIAPGLITEIRESIGI
jgi:hypothetical protein